MYNIASDLQVPTIYKCQRFDDGENEETALRKRQQFDEHDNVEGQNLNENENENKVECDRYVLLPPLVLPPPP